MAAFLIPLLTSLLTAGATTAANKFSQSATDKVMGIPSPKDPKTGGALGADMKAYQDKAFPGTNPWERLGGSGYPGAGVESGKQQAKSQARLQDKDLASKERIAQVQARAHVQGAAITTGPGAVKSALATQSGVPGADYATPAQAQVGHINQQAILTAKQAIVTGHEGKIKAAQAAVAKEIAKYSVTAEKNKSLLAGIENALRERDPVSATSIGLAKAGGVVLGATAVGKFMRGVRFMLPKFGKKIPLGRLTNRKLKPPPIKKGGLSSKASSGIKPPKGKMHKERMIDMLGRDRNKRR